MKAAVEIGRVQTEAPEGRCSEARLIALVANQNDGYIPTCEQRIAVRRRRVEPPLQDIARDHVGTRDETVAIPLIVGADVDQQGAPLHGVHRFHRGQARQIDPGRLQEIVDGTPLHSSIVTDVEAHVETERHWQDVHRSKAPAEVSWFESSPATSLRLIESLGLPTDVPIVDVGGGTSHLGAELLARGYTDVTVTDVSAAALDRVRAELGDPADRITWVVGDVRDLDLGREFDVWHDRALFHFQVGRGDREGYRGTLNRSVARGGYVLIAAFGPAGPTSCSGLPVHRYDAEELGAELGDEFRLEASELYVHETPGGNRQQFIYAVFRRT